MSSIHKVSAALAANRKACARHVSTQRAPLSSSMYRSRASGYAGQPRRHPPRLQAASRDGIDYYVRPYHHQYAGCTDVVCDDAVLIHLQYSTQWDSLAHIGALFDADGDGTAEPVFYNGWRGGTDIVKPDPAQPGAGGARKLGIQNMAERSIQGRGVMIDLRHHYGDERRRVGYDDLRRVMEADRVEVETGDMVCLHTGFAQRVLDMKGDPDPKVLHTICFVLNGEDDRLLQWVTVSGLAVLIADNYAVEDRRFALPEGFHGALLPLHQHCLFKLGVHLGELWHLTPLAEWLGLSHSEELEKGQIISLIQIVVRAAQPGL